MISWFVLSSSAIAADRSLAAANRLSWLRPVHQDWNSALVLPSLPSARSADLTKLRQATSISPLPRAFRKHPAPEFSPVRLAPRPRTRYAGSVDAICVSLSGKRVIVLEFSQLEHRNFAHPGRGSVTPASTCFSASGPPIRPSASRASTRTPQKGSCCAASPSALTALRIVAHSAQRNGSFRTVRSRLAVLQLIRQHPPRSLLKSSDFQDFVVPVEDHHERRAIGGKIERLAGLA